MLKHPTNLEFHEMSFTDWLKALPNDHKAKREVKDIMLSIEIARDYLVDNCWDCHMDGNPYCLLCNLNKILYNYEESLRNTEIPELT